jgi:hypothetical protein
LSAARRLGAAAAVALAAVAGALAACDTVNLGDPPADVNACRPSEQYFVDEIWPNVLSKDYGGKHCYDSKCHDPVSGRRPQFIADPKPALAPGQPIPVPLPNDWAKNYRTAADEMNCSDVSGSKLLLDPEGLNGHGGGKLFANTDPEELSLRKWVTVTTP